MENECSSSPSFKDKLKSSMCCFRSADDNDAVYSKSPRSWMKWTAHDLEIRERCRGLIGMRGKCRRRHNSADFSYDAISYSLNFENDKEEEDVPLNGFVSRLPLTPPRSLIVK